MQPYGFFPINLTFVKEDFIDVSITAEMEPLSNTTTNGNLDHTFWHGYFTGPRDWSGIYRVVVSHGSCLL